MHQLLRLHLFFVGLHTKNCRLLTPGAACSAIRCQLQRQAGFVRCSALKIASALVLCGQMRHGEKKPFYPHETDFIKFILHLILYYNVTLWTHFS